MYRDFKDFIIRTMAKRTRLNIPTAEEIPSEIFKVGYDYLVKGRVRVVKLENGETKLRPLLPEETERIKRMTLYKCR